MNVVQTSILPSFNMNGLELRPFAGDQLMLLRVEGSVGAKAARHAHPHEQISLVISGRVRFWLDGTERILCAGEAIHIPSGVEHAAEFLETTVLFDLYHPVRQDMLARIDANR